MIFSMHTRKLIFLSIYAFILVIIMMSVLASQIIDLATDMQIHITDAWRPLQSQAQKNGTTFLLLGIGGGSHEGPLLTDSITLARYDAQLNVIHTIGIPRDVWDPEIKDKVNSIYAYANNDDHKDDVFGYTKTKFSELLGTKIDEVIVIDFSSFEKLIDTMGDITVTLEKGFVDPQFPKMGFEAAECTPYDPDYRCRYETLSFPKGTYAINGAVALKFVRSRHAEGSEGSDFSRNRRQQIVVSAIQTKLLQLLADRQIHTLSQVVRVIDSSVKRTISNADVIPYIRTALLSSDKLTITTQTFDPDYFEVPDYAEYEGRYVLIPPEADYKQFSDDIRKKLGFAK